jgi:hypothetical protein
MDISLKERERRKEGRIAGGESKAGECICAMSLSSSVQ